ncbi:MAG TPA: hypothetical protein VJL28_04705 [Gemmatimonadaceae bacterium]|nr:hypothetical protein [Gemmatimonadaceae bacterium]
MPPPIDWTAIDAAIAGAAARTDDALASRISSITRLTDDEVKQLFPKPADVEKLAELMKIVKGATSETEKINALVAKADRLAGTALTLLGHFA